jgi:hypothetical protein
MHPKTKLEAVGIGAAVLAILLATFVLTFFGITSNMDGGCGGSPLAADSCTPYSSEGRN